MTLDDFCADLKNYFIVDVDKDIHLNIYTIANGTITLDFLDENQYFRICGSKFNDGVYKYDNKLELTDETFNGAIWAMSVPPAFLDAVNDAKVYLTAHPNAVAMQSESFGGYSYTRMNSGNSSGFWYLPSTIADRLNRYRRIRII
ncbi:MAG: hypothetical protein IKQ46_10570 [Bacteroidales bacterium]|nr:hypothetical protein [Bacteroidales bacterium]